MRKILSEDGWYASEYSFGNNVLWGIKYKIEAAKCHDCCIVRYDLCDPSSEDPAMKGERYIYSFPMGKGDKKAALTEIMAECLDNGQELILNSISEKGRKQLYAWFPGQFLIEENRDYEDYIYDREKLATLSGRKMHNKRNHIARFKDAGEWSYEPLNDNNEEECKRFCKRWVFSREDKWNEDMAVEMKVVMEGFRLRKQLGLTGGVLRQKGVIVAFCMGEEINPDVIDIHFEKALPEYQGAYPMINQQFAAHACQKYTYINREDDTGDPGLRKSKLSYYPEILLKKYNAVLSDIVFADRATHEADIVSIWQTCFGDSREFILDFLDRFMGEKTILLKYADGKPVSMASCLPITICKGEEEISAKYVYAVATLPAYRGRGYASEIVDQAKKSFKEPLILSPAEESLFSYYEKLGFVSISGREDITVDVAEHAAEEIAVEAAGNIAAAVPGHAAEEIAVEAAEHAAEEIVVEAAGNIAVAVPGHAAEEIAVEAAENASEEIVVEAAGNIAVAVPGHAAEEIAVEAAGNIAAAVPEHAAEDYTGNESVEGFGQGAAGKQGSAVLEISQADVKMYKALRDRHFAGDGYVQWDEKTIGYALKYYGEASGGALIVKDGEASFEGIILYRCHEGTMQVIETSLSVSDCARIMEPVCRKNGIHKMIFHHPGAMMYTPDADAFGIEPEKMYFNLEFGD